MRKRENERRDDSGGRERKTVMRARAGCVCVCVEGGLMLDRAVMLIGYSG